MMDATDNDDDEANSKIALHLLHQGPKTVAIRFSQDLMKTVGLKVIQTTEMPHQLHSPSTTDKYNRDSFVN